MTRSRDSSAARKLALSERLDQMVIVMASHAARVKAKALAAKIEVVRQVGHRTERYHQFKGRRSTALDEYLQSRRAKSFQAMLIWLEAQALANAVEGTPREVPAEARSMVFAVPQEPETGEAVPGPEEVEAFEESQRLITAFFVVRR